MQLEGKKKKRQVCYANFPDNWINLQNLEICTVGIGYILVGMYVCVFLAKWFSNSINTTLWMRWCWWHALSCWSVFSELINSRKGAARLIRSVQCTALVVHKLKVGLAKYLVHILQDYTYVMVSPILGNVLWHPFHRFCEGTLFWFWNWTNNPTELFYYLPFYAMIFSKLWTFLFWGMIFSLKKTLDSSVF